MINNFTQSLILPVIGTEYKLHIPSETYLGGHREVDAVYLGYRDALQRGESSRHAGHVFARAGEKGEVELYHTQTSGLALEEIWMSDGDDDPAYPTGIKAWQFKEKSYDLTRVQQALLTRRQVAA